MVKHNLVMGGVRDLWLRFRNMRRSWFAARARTGAKQSLIGILELRIDHEKGATAALACAFGRSRPRSVLVRYKEFFRPDPFCSRAVAGATRGHEVSRRIVNRISVHMVGNQCVARVTTLPDAPAHHAIAPVAWVRPGSDPPKQDHPRLADEACDTGQWMPGKVSHPSNAGPVLPASVIRASLRAEPTNETRRPRILRTAALALFHQQACIAQVEM